MNPPAKMGKFESDQTINTFVQKGHKALVDLETKNDLLQFKVDEWCVWPLMRFSVALIFQKNLEGRNTTPFGRKERVYFILNDLLKFFLLKRSRCLILTHMSSRREMQDDSYKDIQFDELLTCINDYVKIELVDNFKFMPQYRKALVKSGLTLTLINEMSWQLAKLKAPKAILDIAFAIVNIFKSYPELKSYTTRSLSEGIMAFLWSKKLFHILLDRVRPRHVLVGDSQSAPGLIAAAKEMNIEVIEFQHGIINSSHGWYAWPEYALPYKVHMQIPDKIFLYGDYWKDLMAKDKFWSDELCSVGSLRIDAYRKKGGRKKQVPDFNILVTTQSLETENMIEFIVGFLKTNKDGRIKLRIKMHPSEGMESTYSSVFADNSRVAVVANNQLPETFDMLLRADVHVSICSACHYEAIALGVPTVIVALRTSENVMHLYESGHAFLAKKPEDLNDIILKIKAGYLVPANAADYYFKRDALANVINEIGL